VPRRETDVTPVLEVVPVQPVVGSGTGEVRGSRVLPPLSRSGLGSASPMWFTKLHWNSFKL